MTERPSTEAGERLLASSVGWVAPHPDDDGTFIPVVQDAMCESILAIETEAFMDGARASRENRKEIEAAAGPPASAELLERLAAIEHEQWTTWSKEVAPDIRDQKRVTRWSGYWKPYGQLDEATKEHDRVWACKVLAALPEAAVQEPGDYRCDYRCSEPRGHEGAHLFPIMALGDAARSIRAAQPTPASVPTGYWEASGNLTPEMAKSMRPILEQAARDGKQLVVHEGITLRWVKAASVEAEGLDVKLLEAAYDQVMGLGSGLKLVTWERIAAAYLSLLEQREA